LNNPRQLIIGMTVATLAIFFTFKNIPIDDILESFQKANYIYLFPVALIMGISYVIRVYRWRVLVIPLKPVSASQLFPPLMISFLGNMLPMRAGEIFRAYLLKEKANIPFAASLATIMVERMFDVLMLNILFTVILIFYSDLFDSDTLWLGFAPSDIAFNFGCLNGLILCILVTFIYLIVEKKTLILKISNKITTPFSISWKKKCQHILETFSQGLAVIKNRKALLQVGIYTLLDWILLTFSAYPMYMAFNLNNKTIESMLVLAVIVPIFMTLLPTPGFMGSVQAGVFVALHNIMGESEAVAAAYGMVGWSWNLTVQILAGLYFLFREHISLRTLIKLEKKSEDDLNEL
jgi:glycosyltransferase 2 family protein